MSSKFVRPAVFAVFALFCMFATPGLVRAAVSHAVLTSFDGGETPAKSFGNAGGGLAVDAATGDVYVADVSHDVVDKFSAAGKYLCQISGAAVGSLSECNGVGGSAPASGPFAFREPASIAVDDSGRTSFEDPSVGDVYVTNAVENKETSATEYVVDKFSAGGAFLGEVGVPQAAAIYGVAVDAVGDAWVYDEAGIVREFNTTGSEVLQVNLEFFVVKPPFTVDSNRDTYATRPFGVEKFDSSGKSEGFLDECEVRCQALAADLSTDEIYVDEGTSVAEYSPGRELLVRFGESQLTSGGSGGLAVDPISGVIYVSNATDSKVFVYRASPGPRVAPGEASQIRATTATVGARVNPGGLPTTYQFEYGTSTSYGGTVPVSPGDAGSASSFGPVSAGLTGLASGTVYHYRIVAKSPEGTTFGADRHFTTLPQPVVDNAFVSNLSASTATLNASINPEGIESHYRFEWGISTAYGKSIPIPDGSLGEGSGDVSVSQGIGPLKENTTYHWRVVATSGNGTTTGLDHTFIDTIERDALPDGRAYEMVSPSKKDGALLGDVSIQQAAPPSISSVGTRVMTGSIQCFAGAESCTGLRSLTGSPYSFSRGTDGWQTAPLAPPAPQTSGVTLYNMDATEGTALFSARNPELGEDDFYLRRSDQTITDVGPLSPRMPVVQTGPAVEQTFASVGFSHLVWLDGTSQAAPSWPFDQTISAATRTMYEYSGVGSLQPNLVAVTGGPGSHDLISVCGVNGVTDAPGTVSEDGGVVFFDVVGEASIGRACPGSGANAGVSVPVDELYARVGASKTVAISEPQAFSATGPTETCKEAACEENTSLANKATDWRGAHFDGASVDGSRVFFSSPQQLTDSATQDSLSTDSPSGRECKITSGPNGCNLYEFECASCSAANQRLVDVSAGDSSGEGPRVRGVLAVSADGSHVYFVAGGTLTSRPNAEGDVARSGNENLYVYERDPTHPSGQTRFIGTLAKSDGVEWELPGTANVTPDGRYLVFVSRAPHLTPDATSVSGAAQVFRYDAQADQLVRISIGAYGFDDNGNRSTSTPCGLDGVCSEDARIARGYTAPVLGTRRDLTMSDSGAYVFFQSPVALTSRALNDVPIGVESGGVPTYAQNVYEWHEGLVSLISDGRDATVDKGQAPACGVAVSVCLLGSDTSGANVFFSTVDQLVAQDTDTELDYYDARICTSESPCIQAPVSAAKCDGAGCQVGGASQPLAVTVGSVSFVGPENEPSVAGAGGPPVTIKIARHVVRNGRLELAVVVPKGGRIEVTGQGVRSRYRSVSRGGSYRLSVTLTARARQALRRRPGHTMRFRVRVGYTPGGGKQVSAIVVFQVRG